MKHITTTIGLLFSLAFGWGGRRESRERCLVCTLVVGMAGCLIVALTAGCDSASNKPTQLPSVETAAPEAPQAVDGAALLESRCSVCHSADKPKQVKKTREEWEATVGRMVSKGARLTEQEKKALVDYLSNR